jgi:hypothetical protein
MEKNNKTKLTESVMDEVMSIEEAKRLTIESVRKIYEENGNVKYTIEEADAALETMTETILSEFNAVCDKIDAEHESQSVIQTKIAVEE